MIIRDKKVDQGWLRDAGKDYRYQLTECFKRLIQNDKQKDAITPEQIQQLCLGKKEQEQELIFQKKAGITGGLLDRLGKFEGPFLCQLENKKVNKRFPAFKLIFIEGKGQNTANWYSKGGDMARLILEFEKRTLIFVYIKDNVNAIKWQRYLIIERLLKLYKELAPSIIGRTQEEFNFRYRIQWACRFQKAIEEYADYINRNKKQQAKIDVPFLVNMERAILLFHLSRWKTKSQKLYQEDQIRLDQLRQLTQQEQLDLEKARQQQLIDEQKKRVRREKLLNMMSQKIPGLKESVQRFLAGWKSRSHYHKHNIPVVCTISFKSMLTQQTLQGSNIILMRPSLQVEFKSDRDEHTQDFLSKKIISDYEYQIKHRPYYQSPLLAKLVQQTRKGYYTWLFKDGLLGLCGQTTITVAELGYQDFMELTLVDTLQMNAKSNTVRVHFQDFHKFTQEGRVLWIQLDYYGSKIYVEIHLNQNKSLDPVYFDQLQFVQLNTALKKISLKIIEQRTQNAIAETINYQLDLDKYGANIQQLYQRFYYENIGLQHSVDSESWFSTINDKDILQKTLTDILNRNYQQFPDVENNVQIYEQLKKIQELRLPLLKDVKDFMNKNKYEPIIASQLESILNTFMIYANLRTIQLNVAFLPTLFKIASKFVILNHYHYCHKPQVPVFGQTYNQEAQAFWQFTSFTTMMHHLRLPINKQDEVVAPHEVMIDYLQVLKREVIQHCKINSITIESIFYEMLTCLFTNIVESQPLFNIWNIIVMKYKENINVIQIILIAILDELDEKIYLCGNNQEFIDAIKLQSIFQIFNIFFYKAHLMDIRSLEGKYTICEGNLQKIQKIQLATHESVDHTNIMHQLAQDQ